MNNNENNNEAQRYAENIATHMRAWQVAAEYVAALAAGEADDDETGETLNVREWADLNGYAATGVGRRDWLDTAADIARNELEGVETIAEAWGQYIGDALCLELIGKHDGDGWTVTGAELTVTAGGPSCWIEWNGYTGLTVRARWGSERGDVRVDCDDLCEALERCAEVVA